MSVVHLLSEAEQELEVAALHYESQQAGLGAALLVEVEKTFGRISELPLAARAVRGDLREDSFIGFPITFFIASAVTIFSSLQLPTVAAGLGIGVIGSSHPRDEYLIRRGGAVPMRRVRFPKGPAVPVGAGTWPYGSRIAGKRETDGSPTES